MVARRRHYRQSQAQDSASVAPAARTRPLSRCVHGAAPVHLAETPFRARATHAICLTHWRSHTRPTHYPVHYPQQPGATFKFVPSSSGGEAAATGFRFGQAPLPSTAASGAAGKGAFSFGAAPAASSPSVASPSGGTTFTFGGKPEAAGANSPNTFSFKTPAPVAAAGAATTPTADNASAVSQPFSFGGASLRTVGSGTPEVSPSTTGGFSFGTTAGTTGGAFTFGGGGGSGGSVDSGGSGGSGSHGKVRG